MLTKSILIDIIIFVILSIGPGGNMVRLCKTSLVIFIFLSISACAISTKGFDIINNNNNSDTDEATIVVFKMSSMIKDADKNAVLFFYAVDEKLYPEKASGITCTVEPISFNIFFKLTVSKEKAIGELAFTESEDGTGVPCSTSGVIEDNKILLTLFGEENTVLYSYDETKKQVVLTFLNKKPTLTKYFAINNITKDKDGNTIFNYIASSADKYPSGQQCESRNDTNPVGSFLKLSNAQSGELMFVSSNNGGTVPCYLPLTIGASTLDVPINGKMTTLAYTYDVDNSKFAIVLPKQGSSETPVIIVVKDSKMSPVVNLSCGSTHQLGEGEYYFSFIGGGGDVDHSCSLDVYGTFTCRPGVQDGNAKAYIKDGAIKFSVTTPTSQVCQTTISPYLKFTYTNGLGYDRAFLPTMSDVPIKLNIANNPNSFTVQYCLGTLGGGCYGSWINTGISTSQTYYAGVPATVGENAYYFKIDNDQPSPVTITFTDKVDYPVASVRNNDAALNTMVYLIPQNMIPGNMESIKISTPKFYVKGGIQHKYVYTDSATPPSQDCASGEWTNYNGEFYLSEPNQMIRYLYIMGCTPEGVASPINTVTINWT